MNHALTSVTILQVTVEATLEHPFFVFGQGWSACEPDRTQQRYGLECQKLTVGDVCISLTHKDVTAHAAAISQQQRQGQLSPRPNATPTSHGSPKNSKGQGHPVPSPNNRSGNSPKSQEPSDSVNRPPRKRNWSSSSPRMPIVRRSALAKLLWSTASLKQSRSVLSYVCYVCYTRVLHMQCHVTHLLSI